MARRFDPHTLAMIKETREQKEGEIWLVIEHGCWEGEPSLSINAFTKWENALEEFAIKVKDSKTDFENWCSPDETEDDYAVEEELMQAHYEIYQIGNYNNLHDEVYIRKVKVN